MNLTTEIVRELLHYDPETGCFRWLPRAEHWFTTYRAYRWWNSRFANKTAGTIHRNKRGYKQRRINIYHRPTSAHQFAWLYMGESPLPEQIDHINRDATDNRWCNLRASNALNNSKNGSKQSNNTSGYTSVFWDKESGRWFALSSHKNQRKFLGYFREKMDAAKAVDGFKIRHGYSEDHGKHPAPYHIKPSTPPDTG